jgi:hypothetical protein
MSINYEAFGDWYDCSTNPETIPKGRGYKKYNYRGITSNGFRLYNHIFVKDECVLHELLTRWSGHHGDKYVGPTSILDID